MNLQAPQPTTINETQLVKTFLPSTSNRILIVGDIPYDGRSSEPFQNAHYGTLAGLLAKSGLDIQQTARAILCPVYPAYGTITLDSHHMVDQSLVEIKGLVATGLIKALVIMGRQTLKYFKKNANGLDEERGAPFLWEGIPCVATYHPRELYAEWHNYTIVQADIAKALKYAQQGWVPTEFDINYQPTYQECVQFLHLCIEKKPYIATDWETIDSVLGEYSLATCIGIGINGKKAFVIPFVNKENKHYFEFHEECNIWRLLAQVLETCPQIGQNALHYDHWFAAWYCKILMNVVDDTMFAHWECYTEMDKSLAFINSIYLDNSYYKKVLKLARSGKVPREMEFHYCGLDCAITIQGAVAIAADMKELPPEVHRHYKFNVRVSRVFQYMALRGCVINRDKLHSRIGELEIACESRERILEEQAKRKINVKSPKQMKEWLYEDLRLPVHTKAVKLDDGSIEDRETADFITLAYLARDYSNLPALMTAALLRKEYKRLSSLKAIQTGPNGEAYWNFNLVGTETGRASGYKPYNGMGVQPQNPDRRDRDLFEAGRNMVWGKCDLEGADAWTVAGQLYKLGDDTMFNDLVAGLKPAMILAVARVKGDHVVSMTAEQIKPLAKELKAYFKGPEGSEGRALYETCKAVSHGTNYMMQAPTMHMTIFKKSKAEIYVPIPECEKLRLLYLKRYPGLEKLYAHIPTILNSHGYIDCPSGMRRVFFGRADNHRTRVGLSLLPQNNTSYATNRALENFFYRSYNRRNDGLSLIVEPMNQVHDEMDLAFHEEELPLVREIFTRATDFDSEIWGLHFKIPFDPNYGPNWGNCDTPILGDDTINI